MMDKYDINGQLEMLLCWRKPIKAVAAGMGLPKWVLYPYASYSSGILQ